MYRTVICLIIAAVFHLKAQTIDISGKVTNENGKGINGATVALKTKALSAITDADGDYHLAGDISSVNNRSVMSGTNLISLKNGIVSVAVARPEQVRIELFDMKGKLLENISGKSLTAGKLQFDIRKQRFAANMMLVRVYIGQNSTSFRYLPFATSQNTIFSPKTSSQSGNKLAKLQQASIDKLEVSAAGYITREVSIESYEGTVNVTLEMEGVWECTASKATNERVSGSGPHDVVIETNSGDGIKSGTIYRPADLGGEEKYPIFVWGNGGCSQDGFSNKAALGEIVSWGYFVIADGTPGGSGDGMSGGGGMGDPASFYNYITWAIAENSKPCSEYYQSLDTTKIAADGFSCGGLMAINASGDPRFTAIGYTSSGLFNADQTIWGGIHTPIKIMNGGPDDMAYENGLRDYNGISALGIPIIYYVKTSAGHGGDLFQARGDFNIVNLAWLNWQLKGDEGETGKALLMGPNCKYCNDRGWEFKSANWEE
ncbi:MAG TPA: carboxypeptidase-like regulatory domain-containing protein [Chitinispirillaceae bacterium]|nr:carboxypeptidase-like regulatory domain-containing protein [Chitinispirillaceae bacterium]